MALDLLDAHHIDLMITDIMMPAVDGYTLTQDLREAGNTMPVLMITAKDTIDDKEIGYRSGTDDYMVKPIILKEMLLRVRALLRRANIASQKRIVIGTSDLNYNTFVATIRGIPLELPKKEFLLLFLLLSQPERIFTRQQLMDEIWGYDTASDPHTVNVHINRLRKQIQHSKDFSIITVKGLGYKAVIK